MTTIFRKKKSSGRFDMNNCFYSDIRREFVEGYLKAEGDFLIRTSDVSTAMILSVFWKGRVRHFSPVEYKRGPQIQYSFGVKVFPSVEALIDYHYCCAVPLNDSQKTLLLRPLICPKTKYKESDLDVHELIGHGNFGEVHRVYIKSEKTFAAMKTLKESVNQLAKDDFEKEVNMMRTMSHENVVKMIGTVELEHGKKDEIRVLLEFLNKGSVIKLLRKGRLTERGRVKICMQVACGMDYLHGMDIIHRDLAARNVLVHQTEDGSIIAKVCDFGLSRSDANGKGYCLRHPQKIPVRWMAPECFVDRKWTKASDVWSLGIFMWEVFTNGKMPYATDSAVPEGNQGLTKYISQGNHPQRPENCGDEMWQIMKSCWTLDQEKRPKMADLKAQLANLYTQITGR